MEAQTLIVDGGGGRVTADPGEAEQQAYRAQLAALAESRAAVEQFRFRPALRKSGAPIEVLINVAGVEELDQIDASCCDGIGLMRSEFLFRDGAPLPDEDTQYRAYSRFLAWAQGRPVTIRTLDIGGDKPVRGLTPEGESNPFLGLRGVRLTLAHEEVFRTQLRALARAAVHGPLKVMIPMVTVPEEITRTADLFEACRAELSQRGVPVKAPPLGIMVEVPAVAIAPDLFRAADFFSIGSNDLTQYVTASSRDDARVAALNDPAHPAVLRLIESVARHGRETGTPVSLCGDMASEPRHIAALLAAGITSLSVAPARIAAVKAAIAEL
jgi:phosphotransferase system enzyme I (PtsI)